MKKFYFLAIAVVLIDQITKYLVRGKSWFLINYVENTGAAFGILKGNRWLFVIIALIVIYLIFKNLDENNQYGLGLLLGGVMGNLIDRAFLGYVRDFIDLKLWPVFNVADMANCVAVIILIIYLIKEKKTIS